MRNVLLFAAMLFWVSGLNAQTCSGCFECAPGRAQCTFGIDVLAIDCACAWGDCESAIPCDGFSSGDVGEVERLLENGNADALVRFLKARDSKAEYVAARNSIVLFGCSEQIVAVIPVPATYRFKLALAQTKHPIFPLTLAGTDGQYPFLQRNTASLK